MSIEAMTVVGKSTVQPSGRRFVLMALANFADEEWSCFPTVTQISAWTGQADKTVRDHLDDLEREGIITRERTRRDDGTLGRYRFAIHRRKIPVEDHRQISPPADFARGEKGQNPPADFAAQEPSTKPSSTSSLRSDVGARGKSNPRLELSRVLDAEHAQAVIEHRQRIGKPLTAHAAKLLAGKFSRCPDPNAGADAMIVNGWQGFEPDWLRNRNQTRGSPPPQKPKTAADFLLTETMDRISGHSGPETSYRPDAGEFSSLSIAGPVGRGGLLDGR